MIIVAIIVGTVTVVLTFSALLAAARELKQGQEKNAKKIAVLSVAFLLIGSTVTVGLAIGLPQYRIWQQEQEGAAELARAEQNRQIAVQEAKAKEESAKSLANAEVIRAEGVAKANKIIGDSLQNNDAYIHYLWIEALRESKSDVIYVPTEAGIPITESARFFKKTEQKQGEQK